MVGPVPADSAGIGDDDENSLDPPFEAPKGFEIPTDLELPETMKEHAIIEKTAKFIASQDSQMEILLRAKQAGNPQFGFLSPGGKLYRYYRHVLMAIKTNRYPEEVPEKEAEAAPAAEEVEVLPKPKVIVPSIKYKPSVDCAYTQLISKITGAPIPPENQVTAAAPLTPTQLTSLNTEYEYSLEEKPVEVKKVSTGLAGLVQYNSDSEDSSSETDQKEEKKPEVPKPEQREIVFTGKLPPEIFQHVIEKTATYVAKNGYSFEDALRTKNDPRFLFLRKDHEFYPYFAFRVRYLINPYEDVPKSPEKVTITREIANGTVVETPSIGIKTVNVAAPVPAPAQQTQIQSTKPGGAVCFSIKSSKEDAPVAVKSSVIQELGADEEEAEPAKEEKEKSRTPSRERDVEEKPAEKKVVEKPAEKKVVEKPAEKKVVEKPAEKRVVEEKRSTTPPAVIDMFSDEPKKRSPPPIEEPKMPSAEDEFKEQKRQEERIKDKLTAAAREKLAAITKEKQLQLERKKRASMFLSMMGNKAEPKASKDEPEPVVAAPSPSSESTSQDTPPLAPAKNGLDLLKVSSTADSKAEDKQSDASIHSIPSQSTTPESHQVLSSDDDDVVLVGVSTRKDNGTTRRSRSRTRSDSKHKKRKHKHHKSKSKKTKKKKSRSRSVSRSRSSKAVKRKRARSSSRSESSRRSRSRSRDGKKRKKDKKKSHKHHKSSRSSSRSKHQHHSRREEQQQQQREGEDFDWDAL
uniref:Protein suppressor of white apricot n=1 Tax=Culex pipiens TaxID=7175 RepID=A0A8D8CNG4_CULPI